MCMMKAPDSWELVEIQIPWLFTCHPPSKRSVLSEALLPLSLLMAIKVWNAECSSPKPLDCDTNPRANSSGKHHLFAAAYPGCQPSHLGIASHISAPCPTVAEETVQYQQFGSFGQGWVPQGPVLRSQAVHKCPLITTGPLVQKQASLKGVRCGWRCKSSDLDWREMQGGNGTFDHQWHIQRLWNWHALSEHANPQPSHLPKNTCCIRPVAIKD